MIGSTGALYFMEKDKIKELEQEIETHIKLNKQLLEDIDRAGKEIERLNNMINELENIIDIEMNKMGYAKYDSCLMLMKMKIKELKGSDKE